VPIRREVTVIIGGGASGILTALQLQRSGSQDRVLIIEPSADLGKGIAYGTTDLGHILNVRAGCLSAFPDDPGHFAAWSSRHTAADRDSFLPRAWFGEYLHSLIGQVEHIRTRAVDLIPLVHGIRVVLSDGTLLDVDRAVLSTGSSPAQWPRPLGGLGPRWIGDPWTSGALRGLRPGEPILLVGTGLTAVDIALTLQPLGHPMVAVSRHGLLPQAHTERPFDPIRCEPPENPTARSLFAWARANSTELGHWAPVVDALRDHTNHLWAQMPDSERLRLLNHVQRRWEVLRHRMAPQVAARIAEMQESGQLTIVSGGIRSVTETRGGVDVALCDRALRVAGVINCTGPTADVTRSPHPLVRRLLDRRLARPAPLNLGIDTDASGCLPNTDGALWLVGPLRRGRHWETTAIPEIRAQAAELSTTLQRIPELVVA
jgi:uncharacterized NAD(P)/FAD-binding protein YdhS